MYSPRVLGETPGYRRIPNEVRPPSGSVLSDRRDTGTCSPRHAREYVPVGLCKNIPVFEGLRKQVPISRLGAFGFFLGFVLDQGSLDVWFCVNDSSSSVLSDRRDTGTCSPRHAREYVPVGLCKNIPIFEGLRKQVPISRLRVRGFIQFYQQKSLDWVFNPFARAPKSCRRLAIR
jgi:hypothetical protein